MNPALWEIRSVRWDWQNTRVNPSLASIAAMDAKKIKPTLQTSMESLPARSCLVLIRLGQALIPLHRFRNRSACLVFGTNRDCAGYILLSAWVTGRFGPDHILHLAGQRAEHYEMAAYGTLVAWAQAMGHGEAARLLQQTLNEEKAADKKLSGLAEGGINQGAADAAHSEEEEDEELVGAGSGRARKSPAKSPRR